MKMINEKRFNWIEKWFDERAIQVNHIESINCIISFVIEMHIIMYVHSATFSTNWGQTKQHSIGYTLKKKQFQMVKSNNSIKWIEFVLYFESNQKSIIETAHDVHQN